MAVQLTGYVNAPDQPESATAIPAATLTAGVDASTVTIPVSSVTYLPPSTTQFVILIGTEKMLHTSRSGLNLTVTRGVEGATAASHLSGANVWNPVTAASDARNPGPMTAAGDFVYLDANGAPTRLAAPSNGDYSLRWTSSVPNYVATPAATIPGGSTTQIQFNNAGAFGGSANLTWVTAGLTNLKHAAFGSGGIIDQPDVTGTVFNIPTIIAANETLTTVDTSLAAFSGLIVAAPTAHSTGRVLGVNFGVTTDPANTKNFNYLQGMAIVNYAQGASGTINYQQGLYLDVENFGGETTTTQYGINMFLGGGGAVTTAVGTYINTLAGAATNAYYEWYDSQGVFRIREDSTFDGVGQAIMALYNPRFTKYTPGATNYERIAVQWETDVATIRTEASGTGTLRSINLAGNTVQLNGKTVTLSGNLTTTGSFNPTFAIPSSSTWTFPSGGGTLFAFVQGASVADATDAPSAITQLNALISRVEALGLIATV